MASKQTTTVVQTPAEKKKAPTEIKIMGLSTQAYEIQIRGISPLIAHAWSEKAKKEIRDKQQGAARLKKEPKDQEVEFNGARYLVDGEDCIPASGIKKAIMAAATFADMWKNQAGMSFFVRGDKENGQYVTILDGEGKPYGTTNPPAMREDMVRVGSAMSKVADLRYRPEYTPWQAKFRIEFNANFITLNEVMNLVNIAGFSVGLCEWRPQKGGGDFGRFEIAFKEEDRVAAE